MTKTAGTAALSVTFHQPNAAARGRQSGRSQASTRLTTALLSATILSSPAVAQDVEQVLTTFTLQPPGSSVSSWSLDAETLSDISQLAPGSIEYAYASQFFTPTVSGTYTFGQTFAPLDTAMILYTGSFDPTAPGTNATALNDDGPVSPQRPSTRIPTTRMARTSPDRASTTSRFARRW